AALAEAGWLCGTVTAGQAYGGDLEAVSVHSGLLAARLVLGADLVVAAQGPGNAGTGTRWGFSGVSVGETLNAAAVLGGRPVAALRVSGADERPRHYGLSHHSTTAIGRAAPAPVDVAVRQLQRALCARVHQQVRGLPARHRVVQLATDWLLPLLAETPVRLSTMGRGLAEDPAPFLAAAAAGVHAAGLVPGHQGGQPACGRLGAYAVDPLDGHHGQYVPVRQVQLHPVAFTEPHVHDLGPFQFVAPHHIAHHQPLCTGHRLHGGLPVEEQADEHRQQPADPLVGVRRPGQALGQRHEQHPASGDPDHQHDADDAGGPGPEPGIQVRIGPGAGSAGGTHTDYRRLAWIVVTMMARAPLAYSWSMIGLVRCRGTIART